MEEKIASKPKAKKIKTAHSFNRLSHRKTEAMKKKKEEMRRLELSGYCMTCRRIKKMKDVKEYLYAGKKVFIGKCADCKTEIYKKRG